VVLATVGGTIAILALGSLWRLRPKNNCRTAADRSQWLVGACPDWLGGGFLFGWSQRARKRRPASLTPLSSPVVVGTDLLFGLALSAAGGGLHLALGNVNGRIVTELLAGGVAGALAGPSLALCIPARPMRAGLSLVLSILGVQLFWRGVSSLVS
jgi:hypothetical protein